MSLRALLDVNFLLAMSNPYHEHHGASRSWWNEMSESGWASCPLTQNGFVRIVCQKSYSLPQKLDVAVEALRTMVRDHRHEFWVDDISVADHTIFDHDRLTSHRQITNAYLLALAVKNGGRLVTFDRHLSIKTVRGAEPENLIVLPRQA